jgi:hypothetical protein
MNHQEQAGEVVSGEVTLGSVRPSMNQYLSQFIMPTRKEEQLPKPNVILKDLLTKEQKQRHERIQKQISEKLLELKSKGLFNIKSGRGPELSTRQNI